MLIKWAYIYIICMFLYKQFFLNQENLLLILFFFHILVKNSILFYLTYLSKVIFYFLFLKNIFIYAKVLYILFIIDIIFFILKDILSHNVQINYMHSRIKL